MRPKKIDPQTATYASQVLNTHEGQVLLQDLQERFGVLDSIFESDPLKLARNEGQRQVVLHLMSLCNSNIAQAAHAATERINHV